jgi:hypothetical protein
MALWSDRRKHWFGLVIVCATMLVAARWTGASPRSAGALHPGSVWPSADQDRETRSLAPRRRIAVTLHRLWTLGGSAPGVPLDPVDIRFSTFGVLVSDAGDHSIRVHDPASGALRRTIGRFWRGPLEFVVPPSLIGTFLLLIALEASVGRVHALTAPGARATISLPRSRQQIAGCRLPSGLL